MATIDGQPTAADNSRLCPHCECPVGNAKFCPECSYPLDTSATTWNGMRAVAPEEMSAATTGSMPAAAPPGLDTSGAMPRYPPPGMTATGAMPAVPPPGSTGKRRSRLALILAGLALGLAAIAVAAIVLLHGHESSDTTALYRSKLTGALSPVVAANTSVSNSLQSLQGTNTTAAKNAANQAQSAISSARGAVGALSVPPDSTQLSQQVQQALTQEDGYMQAVTATLSGQNAENIAQLRSAATQTQSALVPLAGVAAGASGSLNGSDALASWANGRINATTAAQKKAQKATAHKTSHTATTTTTTTVAAPSTSAPSAPASGGTDCGGGLHAGPNTSCPFAENVQLAWENAPAGEQNSLQVFSPVTSQAYTMTCTEAGAGVSCTGANDASVSW